MSSSNNSTASPDAATRVVVDPRAKYQSVFGSRYDTVVGDTYFSELSRAVAFRVVWIAAVKAQKSAGLPIPEEHIEALESQIENIDWEYIESEERRLKHDVMAHLNAFRACVSPEAAKHLHKGMTSCDVTDNADLWIQRNALMWTTRHLARAIDRLGAVARRFAYLPCLGATHGQTAQPTTVGKRVAMWMTNFTFALTQLDQLRRTIRLRGLQGTVGTQASFLALFDGSYEKVELMNAAFAAHLGFDHRHTITGQTYARVHDHDLMTKLSYIGVAGGKMGTDMRILAMQGEMLEPFDKEQVGSSAMAYKRNPMRCERMCSLAMTMNQAAPVAYTVASVQWLERSLDDSLWRRDNIGRQFILAELILNIVINVVDGVVVNTPVITRRLDEQRGKLSTENLIIAMTKVGGDRQECHEKLRVIGLESDARIAAHGGASDFLDRVRADPYFAPILDQLDELTNVDTFVGAAGRQTLAFLDGEVAALLSDYAEDLRGHTAVNLKV